MMACLLTREARLYCYKNMKQCSKCKEYSNNFGICVLRQCEETLSEKRHRERQYRIFLQDIFQKIRRRLQIDTWQ